MMQRTVILRSKHYSSEHPKGRLVQYLDIPEDAANEYALDLALAEAEKQGFEPKWGWVYDAADVLLYDSAIPVPVEYPPLHCTECGADLRPLGAVWVGVDGWYSFPARLDEGDRVLIHEPGMQVSEWSKLEDATCAECGAFVEWSSYEAEGEAPEMLAPGTREAAIDLLGQVRHVTQAWESGDLAGAVQELVSAAADLAALLWIDPETLAPVEGGE